LKLGLPYIIYYIWAPDFKINFVSNPFMSGE
jgi:hypothetical protein